MRDRKLFTPRPDSSYVYDEKIVLAVHLAISSLRPLLVSGPPGSGKTSLGPDVANTLGWRYYEFVISSRTEPGDLCYRFDTERRLLDAQTKALLIDVSQYVEPGGLWWAFDQESAIRRGAFDNSPLAMAQDPALYGNREEKYAVVLLDELDNGSSDFAKDLVHVFEAQEFVIEETSTLIKSRVPALIIVTTNSQRELPGRFVDRCVALQLHAPPLHKLITVAQRRFPSAEKALLSEIAETFIHFYHSRPVNIRDYLDVVDSCLTLGVTVQRSPLWQILARKIGSVSDGFTDYPPRALEKTIAERHQPEVTERLDVERRQKGGEITGNDVFLSCKNLNEDGVQTRDSEIAAEVYDFLTGKGLRVFLSDFTLEELGVSDYTREIDSALESAAVLLAIGTSADHLNSRWVRYEWESFSNAIRSGRKRNANIFTYIEGMAIADLPWGLQLTQTFVHSEASLQRLYNFINKALSRSGSPGLVIGHATQTHGGTPAAPSHGEKPTMTKPTREQVFISYSHKDKKWRDELDTNLKPYLRGGPIVSWSDQQIAPGSAWFKEIQSALANSKVAVLLVTPDFIASDFIHEHELGPLLKEAEQGGVRILWVPVRASSYKRTALKDYQAVLDPDQPLASRTKAKRDQAWVKICEELEKAVSNIPDRQQEQ